MMFSSLILSTHAGSSMAAEMPRLESMQPRSVDIPDFASFFRKTSANLPKTVTPGCYPPSYMLVCDTGVCDVRYVRRSLPQTVPDE